MINGRKKEYGGIILNPGCSNSCVFCGGHFKKSESEIKHQLIDCYRNLVDFKEQGIKKIIISGSDPLEYEEIIQVIEYIKKSGFEFIQMATNGVRLSDKQFLEKFVKSGIDKLRIPLYGSNSEIHDAVTQTPGSFTRTLRGIKGVLKKAPDIKIQISSLILQQNKDNLLDLMDLVESKLNIRNMTFSVPCITDNDYSYYLPFKDLTPYVRKVYHQASRMNYKVLFTEIPYCVFGFISKSINNTCLPPNLGKYCQPPSSERTSIKDMPSYRLKKKIKMCENCKASPFCDGFFVNDIDRFGSGDLKPLF
ncbi:MAG: radical SAM protein [Candidatus Nealsonbacteria bacterium]|nr:MAG: radical SAM protein [Candidatus Nealsonbacteria bacterium]